MFRCSMRALGAALAFAYTASFVAACLSGCLAAGASEHGCCPSGGGVKVSVPRTDCCAVTPAISVKHGTSAPPVFEPLPSSSEPIRVVSLRSAPTPLPAAAGPPLILRI